MSNIVNIFKFTGNYGGDAYEEWLSSELKKLLNVRVHEEPRLGGIKTIASLLKMIFGGLKSDISDILRPFGLPIYKKNMVVVFHHFDHTDCRWYTRAIEYLDYSILRLLSNFLNIRFVCVSDYWKEWLVDKGFNVLAIIYNELTIIDSDLKSRSFLASKYGLDFEKKWIFLGAAQSKKGGLEIVEHFSRNSDVNYQFIFSGQFSAIDPHLNSKTIWLDNGDYYGFLQSCHIVVANSKFQEGWCRVLHEAILLKIPVVGSGKGGMGELLHLAGMNSSYTPDEIVKVISSPIPISDISKSNLVNHIRIKNNISLSILVKLLSHS